MFPTVRSGPSPSIPVRNTRSSAKDARHDRPKPIFEARKAIAQVAAQAPAKVKGSDKPLPKAIQPLAKRQKFGDMNKLTPLMNKPLDERKELPKDLPFPN
jgi:hypothetical protein